MEPRNRLQRLVIAVRLEQDLGPPHETAGSDRLPGTETKVASPRTFRGGGERPVHPGRPVMRPRGALVAGGELGIPCGEMRRRDVAADFAGEDRAHDLFDRRRRRGTGDAELGQLAGSLEDGLVGVDIASGHLSEEAFGRDGVLGVHRTESGEVDGAVGERAPEKRQLLEGALGLRGLARGAKRQRAQPLRGGRLRLGRNQLQRLRAAPRLQLGCGLFERAGGEIGGKLRVAVGAAADELFFEVVLIRIAHIGACGEAAHEEGRNEEYGGSRAHRTWGSVASGWSPGNLENAPYPSFDSRTQHVESACYDRTSWMRGSRAHCSPGSCRWRSPSRCSCGGTAPVCGPRSPSSTSRSSSTSSATSSSASSPTRPSGPTG